MICPPFEHILVIYLITATAGIIQFITYNLTGQERVRFYFLIGRSKAAFLTFSLLINISATSVIALKAWCAHFDRVLRKHFVDCLD